jgi:DNA-binding MarR family transcriptional regulator
MSTKDQWLNLALEGVDAAQADRVRAFRMLVLEGARLRALLDKVLAPSGLTAQQGALLAWIEAQEEAPMISGVAAGMGMTHQNVKQIALALQRKGFLDIQVCVQDRRSRRLVLTPLHRRFWARRNADDFSAVQAWMAVWSDAEVKQAVRLLRRLHKHLDAQSALPD